MKRIAGIAAAGAVALALGAADVQAQIAVEKDRTTATGTTTTTTDFGDIEFTGPLGYRLVPGRSAVYCTASDREGVMAVDIEDDLYRPGMITEEQAKAVALCAVPGQITSGDMETRDGRTLYVVTIIPNGKQTHSKVEVDAMTGEIVNATQYGGLRGLAGWLRESAERKQKTP